MALVSRMKNGEEEGVNVLCLRFDWNAARGPIDLAPLLLDLLPDFLSIYPDLGRRREAKPDFVAFNGDDRDHEVALRDHDSFTDFSTENEHVRCLRGLSLIPEHD